jgi:hypothetical protein
MTKRMIALSVAVLAIGVLAPTAANAAVFNTTATIVIDSQGDSFNGKVISSKAGCKVNRIVDLFRKKAGAANFTKVGSDHSAQNGDWTVVTAPLLNAQYRAQVQSKPLGKDTCKAANSPVTTAKVSTVSLVRGVNKFTGRVTSPSPSCRANRDVDLERRTLYQSQFRQIGTDKTDQAGNWGVNTIIQDNAGYRAFVNAKQVGAFSCLADFSSIVIG